MSQRLLSSLTSLKLFHRRYLPHAAALALALTGCGGPIDGSPDEAASSQKSDLINIVLPIESIKFLNKSDSSLISKVAFITGSTYADGPSDLTSTVTGKSADAMTLEYYSDSDNTEVGVFASDPTALHNALVSNFAQNDGNTAAFNSWRDMSWNRGSSLVIPYPNDDIIFSRFAIDVPLSTAAFQYGTSVSTDASGHAHVQTTRIYDHGICSADVAVQSYLDDAVGGIKDGIVAKADGNPVNLTARAEVFMEHTSGQVMDQRGGITLGFNGQVVEPWYLPNENMIFMYDFPYQMSSGVLKLGVSERYHDVNGTSLTSQTDIYNSIGAQVSTKIASVNESVFLKQAVAMGDCTALANPLGGFFDTVPSSSDITAASVKLKLGMALGADRLGVSQSVQSSLLTLIDDTSNWRCTAPSSGHATGTLRFIARAKRFNVYPNSVELVWFDGVDTTSTAYVLYLAANSSSDLATRQAAVSQLCSWTAPSGFGLSNGKLFYHRNFADSDFTFHG